MNSRALGLAGGAISSCGENYHSYFMLFLVYVICQQPRSHEVTSTRHSRGEEKSVICSADDVASLSKACRIGSIPRWPHSRYASFSTLTFPTLSRFPSVLICLFHHVCRSTICKILANPRKFVGFRFICKASGSRFSDFYTYSCPFYTNERETDMSFSISEICMR